MSIIKAFEDYFAAPDQYLGNISVFLMFAWFSSTVIKNKRPVLSTLLGLLCLGIIAPALFPVFIPQPFYFLSALLVFWLYLDWSYEGKKKEKILVYCIGYSTINAMMFLTVAIIGTLGVDVGIESYGIMIGYIALSIPALFMMSRTWKSIHFILGNTHFWTFFLLPVSQCAIVVVSVLIFSKSGKENMFDDVLGKRWVAILYLAVLAVSFVADGFFIRGMAQTAGDIRDRERLQALEAENSMTYSYIKHMECDITEMRRYRHDLINLLTTVQLMIDSGGENAAEASEFVQKMTHEISELTGRRYCGCNIINCLLDHEESIISAEGIECDFRAEIPNELCVSEIDVCRVITNLLDNARECCGMMEEESERSIYFNMRVVDDYLYISVRNTRPAGELSLETRKDDRRRHGLGLNIVREITGRAGGELVMSEEDDNVTFTAVMEWKNDGSAPECEQMPDETTAEASAGNTI